MLCGPGRSFHTAGPVKGISMLSFGSESKSVAAPATLAPTMSWRDFSASAAINAPLLEKLSPAEQAVALQLAQGLSNAEIARLLGKSKFTVKSQVSSILTKLGVPTRGRLIAILR